ncbi:MAG: zinc ABC transporter substrate-binding protein [Anaerolineales bacterium]|nr:zinc ABC transporter substrate-binding protein [Anaerolineales bacterium]MCW5855712.1 zinc ABC transporter substrate-binding protein [Anaerolineales bacterium]
MKFHKQAGFVLFVAGALLLSACAGTPAAETGKLQVVATTGIVGDVVAQVGGEHIAVNVLIPAGADPHSFEPTPQDAAALASADVVVANGFGLEESLQALLDAQGDKVVYASEGIHALEFDEHDHHDEDHDHEHEGEEHGHDHDHGDVSDLSLWGGDWISTSAYDPDAFQPAYDAIIASTPELSNEDVVRAFLDEGYTTSFDTFLVEAETVTFTSETGSIACDYAYTGTTPVLQVEGEVWSVFETGDHDCDEYRYLLLSPPHAVEAEASLHFHMIYGSTSPEEIAESSGVWVPALYPAGTDVQALVNMWVASARLIGVYIAGVNGIEAAMTEEEQAALAGATGGHDHEHEDEEGHEHEHEEEAGHDHEHEGPDPHAWMNPQNVKVWADNVAAALSAADPAHAASYQANAEAYKAELDALDSWAAEQLAGIDHERRVLVTDHETLGYFAARYDFEVIGALIPSLSTLSEPSAGELAALQTAIADHEVDVIFIGFSITPGLAQSVAADTGVQLVTLYTEALSAADGPAASYLDMMRYNVSAIAQALK